MQVMTAGALLEMRALWLAAVVSRFLQGLYVGKLNALTLFIHLGPACFSRQGTGNEGDRFTLPINPLPHGIHVFNFKFNRVPFACHVYFTR